MNSRLVGHLVRSVLIGAAAIAAFAISGLSVAQQRGRGNFDHLLTTFPLTGVHAITRCEDCHIGGQMAGTPKQCDYCHRPGSRIAATFKSPQHVPTNDRCDNCHRSAATWAGARFSHVSVTPGTCFSCHNGSMAPGKPSNHIMTTASCDTCHRNTVAWVPAGFSHAGVAPGTCTNCHGVTATGKPSNHVQTTASCDQCHKTTAWLPAGYDHVGVIPGSCDNCHVQGGSGLAKQSNHIPYPTAIAGGSSLKCDACHLNTTSFTSGEKMQHNGTPTGCTICHLVPNSWDIGGVIQTKTAGHTSGKDCVSCHRLSYTSWNSP